MNATAFSTICRAHRAFRIAASLSLQLSGGLLWALWRPLLWALACPLKEEARKPFGKEQKNKHRRRISAKDHGGEISRLIQPYHVWGLYLCGRTQFLLLQWWKALSNMRESIGGGLCWDAQSHCLSVGPIRNYLTVCQKNASVQIYFASRDFKILFSGTSSKKILWLWPNIRPWTSHLPAGSTLAPSLHASVTGWHPKRWLLHFPPISPPLVWEA